MMASARRRILLALLFATLALGALDGLDRMLHDALWGVVGGGEPSVEFRFIDVEELPANKPLLARTIDFLKGEGGRWRWRPGT